eukprot:CAMPEP_0168517360 /NCGR_PEP_ID=MMETSP0405-20121227/5988_1 /TAXON_ID=498012 /ORGANISM="Trichosphaerium sp, Strain Am-I-7 wt" /LENGTH=491 /DNA_ID=CAMNT_0008537321 /DNA_START=11 /DNA_END=1486 /DNA_ORIENTATION=+
MAEQPKTIHQQLCELLPNFPTLKPSVKGENTKCKLSPQKKKKPVPKQTGFCQKPPPVHFESIWDPNSKMKPGTAALSFSGSSEECVLTIEHSGTFKDMIQTAVSDSGLPIVLMPSLSRYDKGDFWTGEEEKCCVVVFVESQEFNEYYNKLKCHLSKENARHFLVSWPSTWKHRGIGCARQGAKFFVHALRHEYGELFNFFAMADDDLKTAEKLNGKKDEAKWKKYKTLSDNANSTGQDAIKALIISCENLSISEPKEEAQALEKANAAWKKIVTLKGGRDIKTPLNRDALLKKKDSKQQFYVMTDYSPYQAFVTQWVGITKSEYIKIQWLYLQYARDQFPKVSSRKMPPLVAQLDHESQFCCSPPKLQEMKQFVTCNQGGGVMVAHFESVKDCWYIPPKLFFDCNAPTKAPGTPNKKHKKDNPEGKTFTFFQCEDMVFFEQLIEDNIATCIGLKFIRMDTLNLKSVAGTSSRTSADDETRRKTWNDSIKVD